MKLINTSGNNLEFKYGDNFFILPPEEMFTFDGFQLGKLKEVRELIQLGFLTFYDEEDTDEIVPSVISKKLTESMNKVSPKKISMFKNVNFDKEIK